MSQQESSSKDVLGLAPYGEAIKIVAQGSIDGLRAFLSRLCLPAAEQLGVMAKEQVQSWRFHNMVRILLKAEAKIKGLPNGTNLKLPVRVAAQAFEHGSWVDDDQLREWWAGLLTSACTPAGVDDGNLIFTDLLSRLTTAQARMLDLACQNAKKFRSGLLPYAWSFHTDLPSLVKISGVEEVTRLDRELDHLVSLGLLPREYGGFDIDNPLKVGLTPSSLALNLYVRCQGSRQSPVEYWNLQEEPSASEEIVKARMEDEKP